MLPFGPLLSLTDKAEWGWASLCGGGRAFLEQDPTATTRTGGGDTKGKGLAFLCRSQWTQARKIKHPKPNSILNRRVFVCGGGFSKEILTWVNGVIIGCRRPSPPPEIGERGRGVGGVGGGGGGYPLAEAERVIGRDSKKSQNTNSQQKYFCTGCMFASAAGARGLGGIPPK